MHEPRFQDMNIDIWCDYYGAFFNKKIRRKMLKLYRQIVREEEEAQCKNIQARKVTLGI